MHVYISADMEGISGIATPEDVTRGQREYERGLDLLHADVNAAVAGAFDAGATDVLVNDSHSTMRNLDAAQLDDRARLVRGNTKSRSMMAGLTAQHDAAFFVGYHAKAGTEGGVLNHTFYGHELLRLNVNGVGVGELGWNARLAAAHTVPVALVTGDDKTAVEATNELGNDVETVAVKDGLDRFTARCRPPSEAREAIREAAARAVERITDGRIGPALPENPVTIKADWSATNHAHRAGTVPGVDRRSGRTTAVSAETYAEAYDASVAMLRAGGAGRNERYG